MKKLILCLMLLTGCKKKQIFNEEVEHITINKVGNSCVAVYSDYRKIAMVVIPCPVETN